MSPNSKHKVLTTALVHALVRTYNSMQDNPIKIVAPSVRSYDRRQPLNTLAIFYPYMLLHGRRIVPLSSARQARTRMTRSSLVKATVGPRSMYGEVLDLFQHQQGTLPRRLFAHVRWMCPVAPLHGSEGITKDFWTQHRCVLFPAQTMWQLPYQSYPATPSTSRYSRRININHPYRQNTPS